MNIKDEMNIERDMYKVFLSTPFGNNSNLNNQVKFYILYTQTFVYDAIHDFGIKKSGYNRDEFMKAWIYKYKKNIRQVIQNLYGKSFSNDESNIKDQMSFHNYIKDTFFNYIEADNAKEEDQSDNFKVTQIFYVSSSVNPWNLLNEQDILQEMITSILNILEIPVTPINQFKSLGYPLDTVIYYNSVDKETPRECKGKKVIIVTDSPGSAAKTQYLQQYIKSLKHYRINDTMINPLSIAHLYDSSPSDKLGVVNNIEIFNNTEVYEYFTFHKDNTNKKITPIIRYSIKNKNKPTLTITNFLFTPVVWSSNESRVDELKKTISDSTIKTPELYIKTGLFKTLGDKAKRDFLYGIKTKQIKITGFDNFIEIFLANDILSAMIGAIDFEGSIISGSNIGIELASGVEFLGVRNHNKLNTKNQIINQRDLDDPPIPCTEPGETYTYVTTREDQEVTSKKRRVQYNFGKNSKLSLKSINMDIKELASFN